MSTSPSEQSSGANTEILKSIAASLKAIHTSLESLTGAVEGVAESIEKAHEPEGDLGVHLVSALKDLSSSLHKRAQQERSPQPQQQNQRHQQGRQERRPHQPEQHPNQRPGNPDYDASSTIAEEETNEENSLEIESPAGGNSEPLKSKPNKGRGNRRRPRGGGQKTTPPSE